MSNLQKWLEKWLMPIAMVLEKQKHLQAVKDGIVGIVPIIIIGSFCPVSYTHLDVYKRQS